MGTAHLPPGGIAAYVTPSVTGFIAAAGARARPVSAAPALVGIALGLACWTGSGMWAAKACTKDGRMLRHVGAGDLFLVVFVMFLQLFIV